MVRFILCNDKNFWSLYHVTPVLKIVDYIWQIIIKRRIRFLRLINFSFAQLGSKKFETLYQFWNEQCIWVPELGRLTYKMQTYFLLNYYALFIANIIYFLQQCLFEKAFQSLNLSIITWKSFNDITLNKNYRKISMRYISLFYKYFSVIIDSQCADKFQDIIYLRLFIRD